MSELNFGDCIGCGLCILGCPAYEETGFDVLTARGRNKALQAGLTASEMEKSISACTLCGYCDAVCPSEVHNVEIVLHLGVNSPAQATAIEPESRDPRVVLGCTIRERAPHLIPSIRQFLSRSWPPVGRAGDHRRHGSVRSLLRLARRGGGARAAR